MSMNNLTTEQIARVFALYFGQQVQVDSIGTGTLCAVFPQLVGVSIGDMAMNHEQRFCRLVLRPLEKMTDSDAVEVAKCYYVPFQATAKKGREIIDQIIDDEAETDWALSQAWELYTLLIGLGYAVPLYFIQDDAFYGKTAIELGLAIEAKS